ncbi:hypothetical protein U1Q18_038316 [Sarracenia purpurea var. burkii]
MESSRFRSFFQDIRSRELNGFRVRKRPYPGNELSKFSQIGAVAVEHSGKHTPPMALSFCKTGKNLGIVAVTDEEGYISFYNTRSKFPSSSTYREIAEKSKVCEWVAQENAIFDVCWIKEDTNIVTASGDQSIKVWDAQEKKCIATLMGHTGSVKSICSHPTNLDLIVSGSRDGSFALWDLRCSKVRNGKFFVTSLADVRGAHISPHGKRVRRAKVPSMSVTSVLYLKDEISIATAGAVDSVVKFWDTRNLKGPVIQASPNPEPSTEKLAKGPVKSFSGCLIESFFVKSALSPDAAHILGGSSDGNAYIWQVNKPQVDPIVLKGHDGEVTAVDWYIPLCSHRCQSEVGKIATSSDDFTVCFWDIENSCYSSYRSPSSIRRRRVMVPPTMECRKLFKDEESAGFEKSPISRSSSSSDETLHPINPTHSDTMPQFGTPKSQKKNLSSDSYSTETFEKTPEPALKSPSSVLNPPSSLKRKTIRDYFVVPS